MSDTKPKPERCAIFEATHEAIAQLLQLPDGAYIDMVVAPVDAPGVLRFRIRGAGHPVELGQLSPTVRPTVTRLTSDDGTLECPVINWDFPPAD
jgi:hypothetical protein